jgi:hypothetical protein
MSDFFISNDKIKCQNCSLNNKTIKPKVENKSNSSILKKVRDPKILFIYENLPSAFHRQVLEEVVIKLTGTNKIDFILAIDCKLKTEDYPSPMYKHFESCNTLKEVNLNDYQAIITSGRGIFAITKSDDLSQFNDFTDSNFSNTFFYTQDIGGGILKRVYPIPFHTDLIRHKINYKDIKHIFDVRLQDKWETYFFYKQMSYVKNFLSSYKEEFLPEYKMELIEDPESFLNQHMDAKPCAWDLETSGLDMWEEGFQIKCITLSFDGITGYYLPFDKIKIRTLKRFLKNKYSILANGKYDLKCLAMFGITEIVMHEDITISNVKYG